MELHDILSLPRGITFSRASTSRRRDGSRLHRHVVQRRSVELPACSLTAFYLHLIMGAFRQESRLGL